ncbi:MAG TPA: type II secretion system F family protein [Ilumatobacter sp.]|nr:type II secretion system F family protein [Ilumatobacter sp.]
MIVMMLLGAGAGAGGLLVARSLVRRPRPIAAVLAGLDRPAVVEGPPRSAAGPAGVGRLALVVFRSTGASVTSHGRALRLAGRSEQQHALIRLAGAVVGSLVPLLAGIGAYTAGVGIPLGAPVGLALVGAVAGFMLPELSLKDTADKRRRDFRHALSAYLDIVNVVLAGGAGIETALFAAADAGDGWGFATIRQALHRSRLTGRSPWDTFAVLGDELGVSELAELGASVALAGSHGARIRASLAAKADTLRGHQIAETEADAEAATERMTIPVAVLLAGFLLFIAYPAIHQVTSITGVAP